MIEPLLQRYWKVYPQGLSRFGSEVINLVINGYPKYSEVLEMLFSSGIVTADILQGNGWRQTPLVRAVSRPDVDGAAARHQRCEQGQITYRVALEEQFLQRAQTLQPVDAAELVPVEVQERQRGQPEAEPVRQHVRLGGQLARPVRAERPRGQLLVLGQVRHRAVHRRG